MVARYRLLPLPEAAPEIWAASPIIVTASEDSSLGPAVNFPQSSNEQM
jgi:hypothetical protein